MFKRTSTAVWRGSGQEGKGALTTQSGVFSAQPYSFQTRFKSEDGRAGTNPEELLAASHAGCFAMALSFMLTGAGHPPEELRASSAVLMDNEGVNWFVKSIHLDLEGHVPGIDEARFQQLAADAKKMCPISKALSAVEITMNARLVATAQAS